MAHTLDRMDMNWFGVLEHHARRTPARTLCAIGEEVVSYAEMAARAAAPATGLCERGMAAGDVVGLLSYNCTEFLETIFAANYLGAIAMPINWRLPPPEVRDILAHPRARAPVCDESLVGLADEATQGQESGLLRARISAGSLAGWTRLSDL